MEARAAGGAWLLRMDNLDGPRCPPGAADEILRQLEAHGLTWDEALRWQAGHDAEYRAALRNLEARGLLYRCRCSRSDLARDSRAGPDGAVYAGTCRQGADKGRAALRARLPAGRIALADRWAGELARDVAGDIGDIIVLRSDGQVAYQLACVVDDEAMAITHVIRGSDLLGSSFQQVALQGLLGTRTPAYGHLPLLVDERGRKLSKQNHAAPVVADRAGQNLLACLSLLGLEPDPALARETPGEILRWARTLWPAARVQSGAQSGAVLTYNALQQSRFFTP
jgi:glutamyl-Q tRNA(Asp) synthetase